MSIESYSRFKDTYIKSDATPSAEDEIYLANNIPTLNNFLEKELKIEIYLKIYLYYAGILKSLYLKTLDIF